MKIINKTVFVLVLFIPVLVFADKTFEAGRDMANNYIYSLPEYSRYLKTSGEQPFGFDGVKVTQAPGFSTGGFLNAEEYRRSITNNSSYLAPGLQYWLINGQALDLDTKSGVTSSGVRVTEYVLHETRVRGAGTQTTPWEFIDGYIVKVGTTDKSMGVIKESYEHVSPTPDSEYDFTLTLNAKYDINIDECLKNKNGKFEYVSGNGNEIKYKVTKVIGDFTCNISLETDCYTVTFSDDPGLDGMGSTGSKIYFKYGSGWYNDNKCSIPLTDSDIKLPTRVGYSFTGYKYNDFVIIDQNKKTSSSIRDESLKKSFKATAEWTPNIYTITLDPGSGSTSVPNIFLKYDDGYYLTRENAVDGVNKITKVEKPTRSSYNFKGYKLNSTVIIKSNGNISAAANAFTSDATIVASWSAAGGGGGLPSPCPANGWPNWPIC